jgi:hypothetical protein
MSESRQGGRASRRRFMAGTVGLLALGLISPLASATTSRLLAGSAPRTWLGRISGDPDRGFRVQPVGAMSAGSESLENLRLRLSGPWPLGECPAAPPFNLSLVYRHDPEQPFHVWDSRSCASPVQLQVHATAGSLAGVQVRRGDDMALCKLTEGQRSCLAKGRHVLLIDPTGNHPGPQWAALQYDANRNSIHSASDQSALTVVLMDVVADA